MPIAGIFAIVAALKAVRKGFVALEAQEIRRQRVECIINLYGLRFVISNDHSPGEEMRNRFMFEINKVVALYGNDTNVQKNLRDFHESRTNERLIALLRSMSKTTTLPARGLADVDILKVFLLTPSVSWPKGKIRVGIPGSDIVINKP